MRTKFIAYKHAKNPIVVYLFSECSSFFSEDFPNEQSQFTT